MRRMPRPYKRRIQLSSQRRILATVVLLAIFTALLAIALALVANHRERTRGVSYGEPPAVARQTASIFGVNVALEQEQSAADRQRALSLAKAAGLAWVRQRFPWAQIEPQPGQFEWALWDAIVAECAGQNLRLIAVLDTSPAWARYGGANAVPTAPPADPNNLARFAATLATRYRGRLAAVQVWDEPNIRPHWGERYASPAEYVALLKPVAASLHAADPDLVVLAGGLAPTGEQSEWNQSDVAYLDGMYRAGAKGSFDALAAKPYGFWSGPEDRRVAPSVLNFSRLILLRETMRRYGDGERAIWAVEFGWNALPVGWPGRPSPWGTDSEDKQAERTVAALRRAQDEWPWLAVACLQGLRFPTAAPDDPRRGFALLQDDFSPRPVYTAVQALATAPLATGMAPRQPPSSASYVAKLAALALALFLALAGLVWLLPQLPWEALPPVGRLAVLGLVLAVYAFSPWLAVTSVAALAVVVLAVAYMEEALLFAVFSIPFVFLPRQIGSLAVSLPEFLVLACGVAWVVRKAANQRVSESHRKSQIFDWPVALFLAAAFVSLAASADLRLSLRELRVVVLEPALLYFLLTRTGVGRQGAWRLAGALLAAGVVISLFGLYQYAFTDHVITAEGVRRLLATYPSPNNLGMFLERVLPLAVAWAMSGGAGGLREKGRQGEGETGSGGEGERGRWGASPLHLSTLAPLLIGGVLALALLLTYSVGAWLGFGAAILVMAVLKGRRALLALLVAALLLAVVLLPVLRVERVVSHLGLQPGSTSVLRLSLWQSSLQMLADHPLLGVGLDGFLELYRTQYIRPEAWREPNLSHPHQLLLEFWLNLGILGVIALVWFLVAFFQKGLRLYRAAEDPWRRAFVLGLLGSMVAACAHGLVDRFLFGSPDLAYLFFLFLALIVVLERPATPSLHAGRAGVGSAGA
jgi:O-antigen ligase